MSEPEIIGDEVRVDFTSIPTSDWPPEGPGVFRVVKCEPQRAKDGSPMLYWEFEAVTEDGTQYRRVWTNTSLKPQALWRLRDLVNALGVYPGPDGFKRSEVIGKTLRLMIKHEVYEGRVYARVEDYAPLA
jgi:hypothetical protein